MKGRFVHKGYRLLFDHLQSASLPKRVRLLSSFSGNHRQQPQRHNLFSSCPLLKPSNGSKFCAQTRSFNQETKTIRSFSTIKVYDLLHHGCLPYPQTWAFQQFVLHRRLQNRRLGLDQSSETIGDGDCVVLLEHAPVYTLGRGADEKHLTFVQHQDTPAENELDPSYSYSEISKKLSRKVRGPGTGRLSLDRKMESQLLDLAGRIKAAGDKSHNEEGSLLALVEGLTDSVSPVIAPNGVPVYRVDRGGEVTFHGPSQLVVYPMFDLKQEGSVFEADLHWYLRRIEDVILLTLKHYGIEGNRDSINTGVWVGPNKIAAVGISSSRWITTHGFALNVDPDLSCFDTSIILPCGIEGRGVTSMAEILRERNLPIPTLAEVASVVTEKMQSVFGITIS